MVKYLGRIEDSNIKIIGISQHFFVDIESCIIKCKVALDLQNVDVQKFMEA